MQCLRLPSEFKFYSHSNDTMHPQCLHCMYRMDEYTTIPISEQEKITNLKIIPVTHSPSFKKWRPDIYRHRDCARVFETPCERERKKICQGLIKVNTVLSKSGLLRTSEGQACKKCTKYSPLPTHSGLGATTAA